MKCEYSGMEIEIPGFAENKDVPVECPRCGATRKIPASSIHKNILIADKPFGTKTPRNIVVYPHHEQSMGGGRLRKRWILTGDQRFDDTWRITA